jgi:Flavin-binding monooxygenase-like
MKTDCSNPFMLKEKRRPRVALIGCGASGMCFLHALATRYNRGDDEVDDTVLPYVTCLEQAAEPGGCWRTVPTDQRNLPYNQACWYDDVWSNVLKECFEFPDYTFQDHFPVSVPTFLPRKELMEYFRKRCLQADPHLLDAGRHHLHEIRYNTVVTSVTFEEFTGVFTVVSSPCLSDQHQSNAPESTIVEEYDYCVWAAGIRCKPRIPRNLLNLLRKGQSLLDYDAPPDTPFAGTILHSIHATEFSSSVIDKCVVLVGDSDSAADVALRAVKLGASKVIILSRSGYGGCLFMGSWPSRVTANGSSESIVQIHVAVPCRVVDAGRSIECSPVVWSHEDEAYIVDETRENVIVENVDTVIFCTGYVPSTDFLSEDLRLHSEDVFSWTWSVPEDFKMRENPLTPDLGEVTPTIDLGFSGNLIPGFYRSMLISNPKMMFIMDINSEYPLLHLEAEAWLSLALCTGDLRVPPKEVIEEEIQQQMLEEMNIAFLRWSMDSNYFEAMFDLGENHWSDDYDDPRTIQINEEFLAYHLGLIARNLRDSKYPVDFGTYGALNELGQNLVRLGVEHFKMLHLLDPNSPNASWATFRDVVPSQIQSIYTGQKAVPLPKPWLDLKPEDDLVAFCTAKLASDKEF